MITPERREQLARALAKNELLPELIDEKRAELRDEWEGEQDAEKRENLWSQLNALNEARDYIYAKLGSYTSKPKS